MHLIKFAARGAPYRLSLLIGKRNAHAPRTRCSVDQLDFGYAFRDKGSRADMRVRCRFWSRIMNGDELDSDEAKDDALALLSSRR